MQRQAEASKATIRSLDFVVNVDEVSCFHFYNILPGCYMENRVWGGVEEGQTIRELLSY